ncbi:L-type lectin-domain containing receptor kinase IV.1 [Linum grandiflorum]
MQHHEHKASKQMAMLPTLSFFFFFFLLSSASSSSSTDIGFTYNRFPTKNLVLDGAAQYTSDNLLRLTNDQVQQKGHAFYPHPITFKNNDLNDLGGHGIAFVISPTRCLADSLPSQYLGLFNKSNLGSATNHIFAVELDTILSVEFGDINNNHVGIDINALDSSSAAPAGYYDDSDGGKLVNLTLVSGNPIQVWVDYDGGGKRINVTLAPVNAAKPKKPLISFRQDLSGVLHDKMFIGFSSATGSFLTILAHHYVMGWSFKMNGKAEDLTIFPLPKLPRFRDPKERLDFGSPVIFVGIPMVSVALALAAISGIVYFVRRQRKYAEVLEDWEVDYGPHRFKFKDLYVATKGFRPKGELGRGGFGTVYKGVLRNTKNEIAVKKVSHDSRQGMREFVAEIVSIGRLRHRNLVSLLGYCRRKGELLLVYDFMPNSSLDKYLYDQDRLVLNWCLRFKVIKGVASGLFYLHEEWEQVVIHRDVKASNVMIDSEWNGRLGDFGLARLYDHGSDPRTTYVAGTPGYLAPEQVRTGKATTSSDVYAFGAFLLEVACGRRPIDSEKPTGQVILVDWVFSCWFGGDILEAMDPNLGEEFVGEEVELVLKLGLLCSHSDPEARPSMRQVHQVLDGELLLPDMSSMELSVFSVGLNFARRHERLVDLALSARSFSDSFTHLSSAEESLDRGRDPVGSAQCESVIQPWTHGLLWLRRWGRGAAGGADADGRRPT